MAITEQDITAALTTKFIEYTPINSLADLKSYMSLLLLPVDPSGDLTKMEIDAFRGRLNEQIAFR